jgi:hypothetical protein
MDCDVKVLTNDTNGLGKVLDVEKWREVEIEENLRVRCCKRLMRNTVSFGLLRLLPSYIRMA